MKGLLKVASALLLSMVIVVSAAVPTFAAGNQPTSYSTYSNSGTRDVVCTTLDGTNAAYYYTGIYTYDTLSQQSGTQLLNSLRTLMTNTHKDESDYDDCHYLADRTDCENNNGKVTLIYTSYQATMSQWNGWNREHVWPQSLGGFGTSRGGSDLHHIRPSDSGVNSSRSNKKYGEAGSSASAKYGTDPAKNVLGGYYNSTYFEPLDEVKGDVARICLYVYARWGGTYSQCSSITNVFQSVDVLLEWCELDPVDTWEMGRNEVVESIQGNRNVFIDYPELAWLVFGREVPDGMQTPSGEAMEGACEHSSTEIKNALAATCGANGYTGDTVCKSCGKTVVVGKVISATGNHAFGAWIFNAAKNQEIRECSTCHKTESRACQHLETEYRNAKTPTCASKGYTGELYCKSCGVKISIGRILLPSKNHAYGEWTESTDGVDIRECSVCGDVDEREHSCLHTNTEIKNKKSATCGNNGRTGDTYCVDCGARVKIGRLILPSGEHSYGEWIGGATAGMEQRECAVCHTVETRAAENESTISANRILSSLNAPSAAQPSFTAFGVVFNAFSVAVIVTAVATLVILAIAVVVKIREE